MSQPDYPQSIEDHRKVLILLRPFENLIPSQKFNKIFDAIVTYHSLTPIPGHQDEEVPRSIQARFVRNHDIENNGWGEFQAHRQVMGLMCVAGYRNQTDVEEACRQYSSWKEEYAVTLVDGLLILVDLRDPPTSDSSLGPLPNVEADGKDLSGIPTEEVDHSCVQQLLPYSYKDLLWIDSDDSNLGLLHSRIRDFMIVVFWLLESMRLNWIQKLAKDSPKTDAPSGLNLPGPLGGKRGGGGNSQRSSAIGASELLTAPFEKREMVGLNRDNRQYQRRQNGRHRKHIGDLSLLCGLPTCALEFYSGALERLRAANDWLWVGAALEGLCAASAVVHYGTGDPVQAALKAAQRPHVVSVQVDSAPVVASCVFNGNENRLSEATRQLLDEHYMLSPDERETLRNVVEAAPVGDSSASNPALPKHCLSQEEIIEKYKSAMEQYKKYSFASVINFEAGLKCCRLFIRQNDMNNFQRRLEAGEFLQRVLDIKLAQPEDKAVRYAVAARLYEMMLFHRKAAFFWGLAGRARVTADPGAAYNDYLAFLLRAAPAYNLQLQQDATPVDPERGWSLVKVEHLQEMATAALKTQQWRQLLDYCSYAIDIGREALSDEVLDSFLEMLATGLKESSTRPPRLRRLYFLPQIDLVKLSPLASHLQPVTSELTSGRKTLLRTDSASPFIYSPHMSPRKGHFRSRSAGGSVNRFEEDSACQVMWVCGEVSRLDITLTNPLVREIEVSAIQLLLQPLTDQRSHMWPPCFDAKFLLGPGCFKTVTLLLEPPTVGKFLVKGWRFSLFGLSYEQPFPRGLPSCPDEFRVQCVPRLPLLEISTDLAPVEDFVQSEEGREKLVADGTLPLVPGKTAEFTLTFEHSASSSCDVTSLLVDFSNDLRICHDKSDYRKRTKVQRLLRWSDENLQFQLPLKPGGRAALTIYVDPSQLPESVVSLETLISIEYSSQEAIGDNWCRRNMVAVVSDVCSAPPVQKDPFAEIQSAPLACVSDCTPSIQVSSIG